MVDEIRSIDNKGSVDSAAKAHDNARADDDKNLEDRGKALVSRLQNKSQVAAGEKKSAETSTAMAQFSKAVQQYRTVVEGKWSVAMLAELARLAAAVINDHNIRLHAEARVREYALEVQANAARNQMRKLFFSCRVPHELTETEEMRELLEIISPPILSRVGGHFEAGTSLKGEVKKEVMTKLVTDAIQEATRKAGRQLEAELQQSGMGKFAQMGLEQMARLIQRKRKRIKKGKYVDENGQVVTLSDAEIAAEETELRELMELFSRKALLTMRAIREEIAPRWAPEHQPWLMQEADRQVYDILLATAEKEMLQETQSWDEIQNLRAGNAVFTLRAADKLTEATARKP